MMEENNLNFVEKEALEGFRCPSTEEKEKIAAFNKNKMKRSLGIMSFWLAFSSVFSGILFCNLVMNFGKWEENLVCMTFFCLFFIVSFLIRLNRKNKKILLSKLVKGEYEVMDCKVYEVEFSLNLTGEAVAKIFNERGQYCKSPFLIGEEVAQKWKLSKETGFLFLRCGSNFYELFSLEKMKK